MTRFYIEWSRDTIRTEELRHHLDGMEPSMREIKGWLSLIEGLIKRCFWETRQLPSFSLNQIYHPCVALFCSETSFVWISYFFVWIRVVWVVGNRWFKIKRIFHNAMDESKILFHKIIFRANIIYVEWEIILINWKKLIDNKKVKKVHFGMIYFLISINFL